MAEKEISQEFTDPFIENLTARVDDTAIHQVALADQGYLIDLAKYQRTTLETRRDAQDTSREPGESSLNNQGLWRRSQFDWSHGAGQTYFDDNDEADRARFHSSRGVDVWTRRQAKLLSAVASRGASAETNQRELAVGSYLYRVVNNALYHTLNPTASSPTWTSAAIQAADAGSLPILDVTTDGQNVWAAMGNSGINKNVAGATTSSDFSAYAATVIGYANGRLIAGKLNEIGEVDSGGLHTVVFEHPNNDFRFTSIVGTPQGILAAGNVGDRGEIYSFSVDEATGALSAAVFAGDVPAGETIYTLFYYGQHVMIGTSQGFHLAPIDNRQLQYGPLIEVPGGVRDFAVDGGYLYFTWSNFDFTYPTGPDSEITEAAYTGLGRADLSEFTAPLVPAYATDLLAGSRTAAVRGTVTSVTALAGHRYFSVATVGVFGDSTDLVADGQVVSGFISYGTVEEKSAVSVDFRHDPLNGSVSAKVVSDAQAIVPEATTNEAGTFKPRVAIDALIPNFENVRLVVTLVRDAVVTLGPVLRRWTLNSLVTPKRQDEILLPIILKNKVTAGRGEGRDVFYDTRVHFNFLKQLERTAQVVTYREGDTTEKVYVDRIGIESPSEWNKKRAFFQGIVTVRLLTVD